MAGRIVFLGYAPGSTAPGLYNIDPTDGSASFATSVSPAPTPGGMGYVGTTLYMVNARIGSAFYYGVVDPESGTFTAIAAQMSSQNWEGLAAPKNADFFYTIDADHNEQLLKVTPGGLIAPIGTGVGLDLRGLTYDDVHSTIYATDYYNGSPNLYSIDPSTGAVTLIGSLGFAPASFGGDIPLAYDDLTQTLYAHNSVTHALYTVDTSTGLATEIGVDGQPIASLAIANIVQANWARAVDGDFEVAGNWNPAVVPDAWTDVSITRGGADYTVTAHSAHEIQNLKIGAHAILEADSLQVAGSAVVSGVVETSANGSIDFQGDVRGIGILRIGDGGGTFEFGGLVARLTHVQFDAGAGSTATVVLDHSSQFLGEVSGLTTGDQFVFKDMSSTDRIRLTYTPNALDNGGVLKINDVTEGIVAKIRVDGDHYATGDFTITDDGHGHALLQNHHLLV